MEIFDGSVPLGTLALLAVCLFIALSFEFVNGFHDTANAVATVIYTKSMKPTAAVLWSGLLNFIGVFTGGAAVAFSIVHLLPVDLLINIGASAGIWMVLSLLLSAIIWNVGTWYLGLPASSSHALIGSILGVGLASSFFSGQGFGSGVNWGKAKDIGMSLLFSPLFGFCMAALLLLLFRALIKDKKLYQEPNGEDPPPWWIRLILIGTCSGVSFAHGSNDGQKGVGLIMLILIGILPAQFALNTSYSTDQMGKTVAAIERMEKTIPQALDASPDRDNVTRRLTDLRTRLGGHADLKGFTVDERKAIRADILRLDSDITKQVKFALALSEGDKKTIEGDQKQLRTVVDFVVPWVTVAVALALGIGTTIGWKRIVVTVGEKIGKTHLTYAQGAAAEIVAMGTIMAADKFGLPVSTTHILSSGIAGTMAANRSGLQPKTLRNIALAWVLTLPATMLLAGLLFAITAGPAVRAMGEKAQPVPAPERVLRKVN